MINFNTANLAAQRESMLADFAKQIDTAIAEHVETVEHSLPTMLEDIAKAHAKGFCPSCGYNLTGDRHLRMGGFTWDPSGMFDYDGQRITLTRSMHSIVGSIMRMNGGVATKEMILSRLGTDAEIKIIDVFICKLRKILQRVTGRDDVLVTVWGRGYRWNTNSIN